MDNTKEEILKMLKNRHGKYIVVLPSEFHDGHLISDLYYTKKHPDKVSSITKGFKYLSVVEVKYPLVESFILPISKIHETELPFILLNDDSKVTIESEEIEAYI